MNKNVLVGVLVLTILGIVFIYISQRQPSQSDIDNLFSPIKTKVFDVKKTERIDKITEEDTKKVEEKIINIGDSTEVEDIEKDIDVSDIEKDLGGLDDLNLDI